LTGGRRLEALIWPEPGWQPLLAPGRSRRLLGKTAPDRGAPRKDASAASSPLSSRQTPDGFRPPNARELARRCTNRDQEGPPPDSPSTSRAAGAAARRGSLPLVLSSACRASGPDATAGARLRSESGAALPTVPGGRVAAGVIEAHRFGRYRPSLITSPHRRI